MDYEQKYKEALVKAQKELQCCGDLDCDAARQIFRLFPELRESEDEKIKEGLIKYLKTDMKCNPSQCESFYNKSIAWLEKQCNKKPIEEYDVPNTPIKDSGEVTSRMKYIDENLKPIAEFIMGYANWDLRKDEYNHPVATVPLFRVLDALVQNGKQYTEEYPEVNNDTKPDRSLIEKGMALPGTKVDV